MKVLLLLVLLSFACGVLLVDAWIFNMLLFLLLPPMYSGSCLHDALTYNCPQLCVGAGPSMQLISSFPFLVTASQFCVA